METQVSVVAEHLPEAVDPAQTVAQEADPDPLGHLDPQADQEIQDHLVSFGWQIMTYWNVPEFLNYIQKRLMFLT